MADTSAENAGFFHLYNVTFGLAFVACLILTYTTRAKPDPEVEKLKTPAFKKFQKNYIFVFLLAFFSDWLQGPYVYALYDFYGFDSRDIAILFIIGFMSSMVFGTLVGSLSDKFGRKIVCIIYAFCYITAGVTKLFNNFWILAAGRFLCGIATSLLFSVFEAWMVSEHNSRGFDPSLLSDTFGLATVGNGIIAIVAGVCAEWAASSYGYVAPFVVAILPLTVLAVTVSATWNENYGDSKIKASTGFNNAWRAIMNEPKVMWLGLAQSSFEGAMYTFVFMWTPALATPENKDSLPYGTIFGAFMACCMFGSAVFSYLMKSNAIEDVPKYIHSIAIAGNLLVVVFIEDKTIVYFSFLLFEVACGIYFPAYGTLRSKYIPEDTRAAVMNIFRIPLNAFVVIVLIKVKFLPVEVVFGICSAAHAVSLFSYMKFMKSI